MKTFGQYHPAVLLSYFLAELVVAMFVTNPVLQLGALLGGTLFCGMLISRRAFGSDLAFYLPMLLLVAVTNPLFSHNGVTPLFFLNGNPVTLEAILYGVAIAVMVIGVMLWCRCYSEVMTSDKFLYLFGRVVPKLSLVLSMTLRFVPMFRRQMHKVSAAQKAMGLYASSSVVGKVQSALRVFTAMITWSFENAMDTAASMKARGYGSKNRTNFSLFRFRAADGVLLAVCAALLGTVLIGTATGAVTFYFYPRISVLPTTSAAWAVYLAYGVLSFLPFILELKEVLVWRFCVSSI